MIEVQKRNRTRDKSGMLTYSVNYLVDSEDGLSQIPFLYRGLFLQSENSSPVTGADGKWLAKCVYKGLDEGEDPELLDRFQIQGAWREEPIEAFPDRNILIEEFGGYIESGKLLFPERLPTPAQQAVAALGSLAGFVGGIGGSLLSGAASAASAAVQGDPNPLFNVRTYPVYYDVATHSYVRKRVPAEVLRRAGTVVESLPSGFEYDGPATAWLYDAPDRIKEGNAWRITERAKEVDKLKHLSALYLLIKGQN